VERAPPPAALDLVLGSDRVERAPPPAALDLVLDVALDLVLCRKRNRGRAALKRRVKL